MTEQPKKRIRINISTSVKGIKTWDATIELSECHVEGSVALAALAESDFLVAELDKRYPSPEVG